MVRPSKFATNICAPKSASGCADSNAITVPTRQVSKHTMGSALTPAAVPLFMLGEKIFDGIDVGIAFHAGQTVLELPRGEFVP